MNSEQTLKQTLLASTLVISKVGRGSKARIFPDVGREDYSYPSIAYERSETVYSPTIHSSANVPTRVTFTVTCMSSRNRDEAIALSKSTKDALTAARFIPTGEFTQYYDQPKKVWVEVLTMDYWEC